MNELEFLIKEKGQNIRVFYATETVNDPNYEDKTVSFLNSLPVRAIVADLSYAQAQWRLTGINSTQIKEVTCHKRYKALIEKSRKIQIGNETFYGYKPANGNKLQIKTVDNYIIILVHTDETA